jgi:hypothetical protein
LRVDRSKIETKKNIDGKPQFLYRETQFNLNKRQVIDLLMGTKLYGNPEVALRELLQNSIDACLLRKALEKSWENDYAPEILVKYSIENGEDILEVVDNGIGMNQYIIDNYYSRVGSSFYKSADFYSLKAESNADFVPTSRFGIGILSCFMVADSLIVDTRSVDGPHTYGDPINLTIEGQESIFWIRSGARKVPGTSTKLVLRKGRNPWDRMSEEQFIRSVESVVPNPPFKITIDSRSKKRIMDQNSFVEIDPASLGNYSWEKHKNISQIAVRFSNEKSGVVGAAIVAVLQKRRQPVVEVQMHSKSVVIDGESYDLKKRLGLNANSIGSQSTSISIDEEGNVDASDGSSRLCHSVSRLSLHGIEVPAKLFPDSWEMQGNQVQLQWPLPMLLVVDVCGHMDLDLNSSRTQVLVSEKWTKFEQVLCYEIFCQLAKQVGPDYWSKLKKLLIEQSKSPVFAECLLRMN